MRPQDCIDDFFHVTFNLWKNMFAHVKFPNIHWLWSIWSAQDVDRGNIMEVISPLSFQFSSYMVMMVIVRKMIGIFGSNPIQFCKGRNRKSSDIVGLEKPHQFCIFGILWQWLHHVNIVPVNAKESYIRELKSLKVHKQLCPVLFKFYPITNLPTKTGTWNYLQKYSTILHFCFLFNNCQIITTTY